VGRSPRVVHRTRRTATAEGRVFDGEGNLVAVGTGAFRIFEKRATRSCSAGIVRGGKDQTREETVMETEAQARSSALELFHLSGKTAVVTGGGRGLGQYMAEALSDAGANVVLCSRKLEALEEVKAEIEGRGGKALALECDVTDPDDVDRAVKETEEAFGAIDVLVNNSGATWGAPPEEMPLDKFDLVVRVNVRGTFLMSQAVGRRMIERGEGGRIINISSVAGLVGGDPQYMQTIGYNSSKGAVISMTRSLATSWARHGINVNAIAPGWFPTKMSGGLIENFEEKMLEDIPLGRFGAPEDIKGAVLFLASPAAAYVTGQTVVVDGGATAW
jgi:NAD(P)-dependent dehydrogenase (short-subunit alcohol dehydrogenase family)